MASRLIQGGSSLVVQTRTTDHGSSLAAQGAEQVFTPAEVASRCAVVFSCLLDNDVVEHVYLGRDGLLESPRSGQVFVEHGTFDPRLARRLAGLAAEHGARFLDAPITGGAEGAEAGALVCMAGGDLDAFTIVEPLLRAHSKDVVRVGDAGSGLELKLVNQLLVAVHVVAAAEAAVLIERLGLPQELATRVLTSGWGTSAMLDRSLPRIGRREFESTGAPIGGLVEVLRLVAAVCDETEVELALFPEARSVFSRASASGFGSLDMAALVKVFEPSRITETGGTQ
jgi:3-hydroxyisobutyrate dehydrogenase-like beta-hydroxyacid dehydrogenase